MGEAKRRKAAGEYPEITVKPVKVSAARSLEPLSWEVVGDAAAHPKTAQVLQLLEELKDEHEDGGGRNQMVVVLEDLSRNQIVRIKAAGLGVFMGLIGGLEELGLNDRLADSNQPQNGIDAAFN